MIKEACKPDVEPKVGGIYRVTHDVYLVMKFVYGKAIL